MRERLPGFIQLSSRKQQRTLRCGEAVFHEGDPSRTSTCSRPACCRCARGGSPAHREGSLTRLSRARASARCRCRVASEAHEDAHVRERVGCEVVSILGSDFLRLVEKSSVVRESLTAASKRQRHNDDLQVLRTQSEERNDPVLKKYAAR